MWNFNYHEINNGIFKHKNEIRINHHPRLFSLYFSKKKWKSDMNFEFIHSFKIKKKSTFLLLILAWQRSYSKGNYKVQKNIKTN